MKLTLVLASLLIACHSAAASHPHIQRDFLSQLISAASTFLAGDGDTATTTTAGTTLKGPPVAATATTTNNVQNTKTANPKPTNSSQTGTTTSSSASSSTITSTSSTASTISSITSSQSSSITSSTLSTSTTQIPVPSNPTDANPSPAPTPSNNSSGITGGGIAVAVILSLFTVSLIAWLIFRYHPRSRAWWTARQERKFQERSYRDALDGPNATTGLRQRALGGVDGRKSTYLASFFAPRTVRLGGGKEIRRKPVEWGASSSKSGDGEEKVALADMASPMGMSPVEMIGTADMVTMTKIKGNDKPLPRITAERLV